MFYLSYSLSLVQGNISSLVQFANWLLNTFKTKKQKIVL